MDHRPFPDESAYPIATPIDTYLMGLDIIGQHWSRTTPSKSFDPGSYGFQEYLFWRKNLIIWACCTIEALINMEDVCWMGEEFYRDTVERQNAAQKIRLIYAIKYNKILPPDEETVKSVKTIFELRNQLVHPKTRRVDDASGKNGSLAIENLDRFDPAKLKGLIKAVGDLIITDPEASK